MTTECCGNCRFYHDLAPHRALYGGRPITANGQCRRRAPIAPPMQGMNFIQPFVDAHYWCGEWEQGEERE